ncbi:MAG: hypothetical protein EOP88_09370 [Verrucomicrobiaceae bacterium]|nr:MAG: hypothetical protein EOP88_09370 [Verrucomicrobiaceae bacterium]
MKFRNKNLLQFGLIVISASVATQAGATTGTWTNGAADSNWQSVTNWSTATAFPGAATGFTSADDAIFSTTAASGTINLGGVINARIVEFGVSGGNAASFTIGDADDTLNFTTAGGVNVTAGVTAAQNIGVAGTTVNLSTAANSTATLANNGSGLLTVAGNIAAVPAAGNSLLTVSGTGNVSVTGSITETGAGNSALLKTGGGTLTLSGGSLWTGNAAIGRIPAAVVGAPLVVREGILRLNGGTHTTEGETIIGGVVTDGGAGQNARILVDSGSFVVNNWLSIGRGNGIGAVSSDLVVNNAATVTATNLSAGYNGNNATNLPKGEISLSNTAALTITGNGAFHLAESAGSNFVMNLNNSAQFVAAGTGVKRIGNFGTGVLNVKDASTVNFGNQLTYVGYRAGNGALNLSGGSFTTAGEIRVGGSDTNNGAAENAVGTLSMTGGTLTSNGLVLARGNNNAAVVSGTATLGAGTANISGDIILGFAGADNLGHLTLSGATVNFGTAGLRWLRVGNYDTAKGRLDISAGTLNLQSGSHIKMNGEGTVGANVINQTGGTITAYSDAGVTVGGTGHLDMQRVGAAASNNTYNLNGGTLAIGQIISAATTGTRTFNFNGGTLKAVASSAAFMNLGTGNAFANVRNGGAIIDTNSFSVTVPQGLQHSNVGGDAAVDGGLTKAGTGNLTLMGFNTYTGTTLVSNGTLTVGAGGSLNSSSGVTINGSGAKFLKADPATQTAPVSLVLGSIDGNGIIGSMTVSNNLNNHLSAGNGAAGSLDFDNLTFQGAATLDLVANGSGASRYIFAGVLSTSASADVVINATNTTGAWTSGQTYPLLQFGSYGVANANHFTLGTITGLNSNQTATLINDGSSISVSITGESLVWTGRVNSNWTTAPVGGTRNWSLGGNGAEFTTSSPVIFDDTPATFNSNFTVNLAQNVAPSVILFENTGTNDYTISSSGGFGITGGSIIKNGDAKVRITTTNSYTGSTTINAGVLEIGGTGSIASSSIITNNGGLVFDLTNSPNVYPNPITGTGTFTKKGAGTLTLSGANTYNGDFTLEAGALNLNSAGAIGSAPGALIINGGVLDNTSGADVTSTSARPQVWNTDITFTGSSSLAMGTGTVTLGGTGTVRSVNVAAKTLGAGAITGALYGFTKTGTGTLQLSPSAASNIGGTLGISAGTLNIGTQDFIATGLAGSGVLGNGSAVERWVYINNATDQSFGGTLQNSGTGALGFQKQGAGTLTLSGANTNTGAFNVGGGTLVLTGSLGTNAANAAFRVGVIGGAPATLRIQPAAVIGDRLNLHVGVAGGGAGGGAVYQNGSSVNLTGTGVDGFRLGSNAGGYGYYRLSGGSFTLGEAGIGGAANDTAGVMDITGGTFTTPGYITLGRGGLGSSGVLNVTGGSVSAGRVDMGWGANDQSLSVLNVANTTVSITQADNGINLANSNVAGVQGIANLLPGGTLTTTTVRAAGASATALLNFNGGTLKAAAVNSGVNFLSNANVDAVTVYQAGGTIDNSGTAVTIGRPVASAAGHGVSAIVVTGGTGYIGAPLVRISGGTGSGATAHATIDANGNLTGIVIDSPGSGYSPLDVLNVTLTGGAGAGATVGAVTLAANTGGNLAFSGANLTTLTAVNTHTGNMTVAGGSMLVLADNAALTFVPKANGVSNKLTGAGSAFLYGDFTIDTSSAVVANGNSWTLVDTSVKTFDPLIFTVTGYTEVTPGVHQLVDGTKTWTFTESTGVLSLAVSGAGGFGSWITGFGLAVADQDPTDDPDHDGLNNLLEYVLGGNPSVGGTGIAPVGSKSGSNFVLTLRRTDLSEGDTAQVLEYGTGLTGWTSVTVPAASGVVGGVTFTVDEGTPATEPDVVTATIPAAGAGKFFARIKAVK